MTRTVESMIRELSKFRRDAYCYAYEGEVCGIVIDHDGDSDTGAEGQGIIYCGEGIGESLEKETQVPDALRVDVATDDVEGE